MPPVLAEHSEMVQATNLGEWEVLNTPAVDGDDASQENRFLQVRVSLPLREAGIQALLLVRQNGLKSPVCPPS